MTFTSCSAASRSALSLPTKGASVVGGSLAATSRAVCATARSAVQRAMPCSAMRGDDDTRLVNALQSNNAVVAARRRLVVVIRTSVGAVTR